MRGASESEAQTATLFWFFFFLKLPILAPLHRFLTFHPNFSIFFLWKSVQNILTTFFWSFLMRNFFGGVVGVKMGKKQEWTFGRFSHISKPYWPPKPTVHCPSREKTLEEQKILKSLQQCVSNAFPLHPFEIQPWKELFGQWWYSLAIMVGF